MNNWNWNLDELVDKVMADLRSSDVKSRESDVSAALTRDFRSIQSQKEEKGKRQEKSESDDLRKDLGVDRSQTDDVFTLAERVVYSEVVCKVASQTASKRWKICSNAVVTPSAKDELKKRNIELLFGIGATEDTGASRRDGVNFKTFPKSRVTFSASNARESNWGSKEIIDNDSKRPRAFLANHLPDSEKFPANLRDYLTRNSSFEEVQFSCLKEASRQIQTEVGKDKSLKVILTTHDGAVASVWCNRLSGVRAVVVFEYEQFCQDLAATNANVVIVDTSRVGSYQFRRVVDYYLRSEVK